MRDELKGKAVLVTGASTGIGAAVAKGFGRHGARELRPRPVGTKRPDRFGQRPVVKAS